MCSSDLHLASIDGASLPVLAVHGDADPISDVAGTRALEARGIDVHVVEGGMHHLLHDRKSAETRGAITAWIDERCGG